MPLDTTSPGASGNWRSTASRRLLRDATNCTGGMRAEPCAAISACSKLSLLIISAFMAGPYFAPLTPMVKLDGCGAGSLDAF
jgi:hypothetical protein